MPSPPSGGQPEYYPWHKLFLTQGALYLIVVDLAEGEEARKNALLEQLDILNASVPGAVVIVVGTKADLRGQQHERVLTEQHDPRPPTTSQRSVRGRRGWY